MGNGTIEQLQCLSEENVKTIIRKYRSAEDFVIDSYNVRNASNKMLGFLSDYLKLKVNIISNGHKESVNFFIKVVSKTNAAKADMVREWNLFQKETFFYHVLKERMQISGLKPWSAKFITSLDETMVFEDLNALQYTVRNKFDRFDMPHTLQVLQTLARFHASSIILEEKKSKMLGRPYVIHEEYEQFLDTGGYKKDNVWFQLCLEGALEAVKTYSKYSFDMELIETIETHWRNVWYSAMKLSDFSEKYRNVICHRDLWNNSILFHYKDVNGSLIPDDCVLVDFAVVRCHPPAGDVMLVLYCNLDPKFREENMDIFLNHYYNELKLILCNSNLDIEGIETKSKFFESAEEYRQWALVVCSCLMPQFWIDEDLMKELFTDTARFKDILNHDKGAFIKKMMEVNQDYKEKVGQLLDEIIERYCLQEKK